MNRRLHVLLVLSLLFPATRGRSGEPDDTLRFKVRAVGEMASSSTPKVSISGDAEYVFSWVRKGSERTYVLNSMRAAGSADGKKFDFTMSATGVTRVVDGKKTETRPDQLPKERQAYLKQMFDSPLCHLNIDAEGKESSRKLLVEGELAGAIEPAMDVSLLFFPPFNEKAETWESVRRFGIQPDIFAEGKLTYRKDGESGGFRKVAVSGTLTKEPYKTRKGATVQDTKYDVAGHQLFDPKSREWVSAELKVDLAFTLIDQSGGKIPMKGPWKFQLERVPGEK